MGKTTPPEGQSGAGRRRAPRRSAPSTSPAIDAETALAAVLESAHSNLVIFDRDATVVRASRSAAELMHASVEELIGMSAREHMASDLQEKIDRVLAGEAVESEGSFHASAPGEEAWMRARWVPLRSADGSVVGGLIVATDVSEQRRAEELAQRLALFDPVTALPNRGLFTTMLDLALFGAKAKRRQLALAWLNLDRFKDVNDAFGQPLGDLLLRAVGERLRDAIRTSDTLARVGGDDFLLLLPRIRSRQHIESLLRRLQPVFSEPFLIDDRSIYLTASCGVAVHPNGGADARQLEENAHTAMRAAKSAGGNSCAFFEADLSAEASARFHMASDIRRGIDEGHFILHFQPQVGLPAGDLLALEALARWEHPERGLLAPREFLPFAEESGLIVPLGKHLLQHACGHLKQWHEGSAVRPRVAVNVSARELQRDDLCSGVLQAASKARLEPAALEVEITETAVLADSAHAAEVTAGLREAGVTVTLDDFGTGYSSLTHLRELPIDRVKIDSSFVASCLSDRSAAAILVSVTHLAHDLGLEVVAEGVETQAQLEFVSAVGCDAAQGYHLARPLPAGECNDYLLRAAGGPLL